MSIHDGHRERLRESFRKNGLDGFDAIRSLELLLQFAIPRRDTNPIAHALLEDFGSLQEVFDASEQELLQVEGIGPSTAVLLRLVPQILKKSAVDRAAELRYLTSTADARDYLMPHFLYERDEKALLLCLDSQRRVIRCEELARGVVNAGPQPSRWPCQQLPGGRSGHRSALPVASCSRDRAAGPSDLCPGRGLFLSGLRRAATPGLLLKQALCKLNLVVFL